MYTNDYGEIIKIINTYEVLKYILSDNIKKFVIKLSYKNNIYIVEDDTNNLTYFDKDLNIIKNKIQ